MCAGRTSVAGRRERVRFLRHRAVGTRARSRCAAHSALRPEGPAVPGARLGRDEKVILVLVRRRNQRPTALSETKRNARGKNAPRPLFGEKRPAAFSCPPRRSARPPDAMAPPRLARVAAADLDEDEACALLHEHGCLVVTGAVPKEACASARAYVDARLALALAACGSTSTASRDSTWTSRAAARCAWRRAPSRRYRDQLATRRPSLGASGAR